MSDEILPELIELSHAVGRHPSRMAIWHEGACAAKTWDGYFFVSRRGANLSELAAADLVKMNLEKTAALISQETVSEETFAELQTGPGAALPSLDAILFAWLLSLDENKFAVHAQPVEVNQILGSPRARQFAERRTVAHEVPARGVSSVLMPYADPGLPQAREVKRKLALWRDRYKVVPKLLFIQNHGMITLGNSREEILLAAELAIKSARIFIGAALMGGPVFLTPDNVQHLEAMKEL